MTMGWLGDFWGRERVYLLGLAVFTFPLALTALQKDAVAAYRENKASLEQYDLSLFLAPSS